jgi:hypothetical protein
MRVIFLPHKRFLYFEETFCSTALFHVYYYFFIFTFFFCVFNELL